MRCIFLLLFVIRLSSGEVNFYEGYATWWLKDGKVVQGTWISNWGDRGSGLLISTSEKGLVADRKTGQVFVGDVAGPSRYYPLKPDAVADRSPPDGTYVTREFFPQIAKKSSFVSIVTSADSKPILLAHIRSNDRGKSIIKSIELLIEEKSSVRLWQQSRNDNPDRGLFLLGDHGSLCLQADLIRDGLAVYDRTDPAPHWWGVQMTEAEAEARELKRGLWDNDEWGIRELERQKALIDQRDSVIRRLQKEIDTKPLKDRKGKDAEAVVRVNKWLIEARSVLDRDPFGTESRHFLRADPAVLCLYARLKHAAWLADAFLE